MKPINKEGPRYRFGKQLFYAWNGMIAIEDQNDGNFKTVAPAEFFARAINFNVILKTKWQNLYEDERTELTQAVGAMCECVRDARNQGDPTQPGVMHQVALENRTIPHTARAKPGTPTYFLPAVGGGAELLRSEEFKKLKL